MDFYAQMIHPIESIKNLRDERRSAATQRLQEALTLGESLLQHLSARAGVVIYQAAPKIWGSTHEIVMNLDDKGIITDVGCAYHPPDGSPAETHMVGRNLSADQRYCEALAYLAKHTRTSPDAQRIVDECNHWYQEYSRTASFLRHRGVQPLV